ncbi:MAG: recombination protein NinB [Pseudomonadota bacterium]|nr:recombination protein NinB [Pseudomonadota bacterium]
MSERTDWQEDGTSRMTREQQKLLNAACGDLAAQIIWHDNASLTKDDWRHTIAAAVLGIRMIRAINTGEGGPGLIMLGRSSLDFTRTQATKAIRMAFDIGDNPEDQDLHVAPVRWGPIVTLARYVVMDEMAA